MAGRKAGFSVGMLGLLLMLLGAFAQAATAAEPAPQELVSSPTASLTITKAADPFGAEDDTVFEFGGSLGGFSLADGESVTFAGLEPGAYTVAEVLPAGWRFDGVTCLGVEPEVSAGEPAMTVTLRMGEPAACTFYNYQEQVQGPAASLTVVEQTTPAGGEGFSFDAGELGTFTLADGGSQVFSELAAGTYTVAQDDPGGDWLFRQVQCRAGDYQAAGATVTVNLGEGEAAVCTFTNGTGELPFTGLGQLMLPLLIAGVWALLVGLVVVIWPWVGRAHSA